MLPRPFRSLALVPLLACSSSPSSESLESLGGSSTALWPEPLEAVGGDKGTNENPWLTPGTGSTGAVGGGSSGQGDASGSGASGAGTAPGASGGEGAGSGSGAGSGGLAQNGAGSGAGATASGSGPGAEDETVAGPKLLLVRYIETTSAEKQLWLSNVGRAMDAGECELVIYANGALEPYRRHALPALAEDALVRLCTSTVADCEVSLGASSFNGNDALVLSCLGQVVDSFGRRGEDPGKGWGMAPLTSVDAALVRCSMVADTNPEDEFQLAEGWAAAPAELSWGDAHALCDDSGLGGEGSSL